MESTKAPRVMNPLVILSAIFLAASLIVSGVNAYVAFASPNQSTSPNVPLKVGFEGQLSDSSSNPITGSKYLTFQLYSQNTGGTSLWCETQQVTVTGGLYSVRLGDITALTADKFQGSRWLGISVGTSEPSPCTSASNELSPRIPISSVPFALNAKLSENSISSEGLLGIPVSTATPQPGQSLIYGQSAWNPANGGAGSFSLTSSTATTTIISRAIPANSMSATGHIHSRVVYLVKNSSSGTKSITFTITLGNGTTNKVITRTESFTNTNSSKGYMGMLDIDISNMGATNSQMILMNWQRADDATAMDTNQINWSEDPLWDTAGIDTTGAQTFSIKFAMSASSSSFTTYILSSTFEGPISN